MPENNDIVLNIENLKTWFYTDQGRIPAVDGVSFSARRGRILAIVGESGCGKSVTAFSILRLIQKPGKIISGKIIFSPADGKPIDILDLDEKSDMLYHLRGGKISMIFQEPMTALSPVHSVGDQITEAILLHQDVTKQQARHQAIEMLSKVGIPGAENRIDLHPHEMSGGMRQRVVIAMAMVCNPEILIADEPTTALDVTIQAQIIALMKSLQKKNDLSVILITHDLGVVAQAADEVAVMYLGRIVEQAPIRPLIKKPRHPYTMGLLKSLPSLGKINQRLPSIKGSVPSLTDIPSGCPFHPRCPFAEKDRCDIGSPPPLRELEPGINAACLRAEEIL